jgi:Fur family ferric uptake transcriptional regulator
MDCLSPESLNVDTAPLWKTYPGRIDKVEVRIDGLCKNCENSQIKD